MGARAGRVEHFARKSPRLAAALLPIVEDTTRLDRCIATCQIGITLSILILGELGRPPVLGDSVRWNGLRFEVSGLYGRGVRQAALTFEVPETPYDEDREHGALR